MRYYGRMKAAAEPGTVWSKKRHRFAERKANGFFIGVLLDRQIPFEKAWEGGRHLAENHFQSGSFWEEVKRARMDKVDQIARSGFDGKAYFRFPSIFAQILKRSADLIVERYEGDVRKVWNVSKKDVDLIYERLKEFWGIGDALAKMGQFALVRDFGLAGGASSRMFMSVKPDIHVRRVTFRMGLSASMRPPSVVRALAELNLDSAADFDLAVWRVGQNWCHKTLPECGACPVRRACDYALDS